MSKSEIDFSTIGTYNVITPLSSTPAVVTAYLTPVSSFPNLGYVLIAPATVEVVPYGRAKLPSFFNVILAAT